MNTCKWSVSLLLLLLHFFSPTVNAQIKMGKSNSLSPIEQSIVAISAYTAQGDMPALKSALNKALDAGLTINEAKEILVQLYAYTGFPRSLNALNNLMGVVSDRKRQGIADEPGKKPAALRNKSMLVVGEANREKLTGRKISGGVYDFVPVIDQYLKEHLFGAIFSRDNLDWKTRELVTIAALTVMSGAENQLQSHIDVGMYNGLTVSQMSELISIIENNVDSQRGIIARHVLQAVIDKKPYAISSKPRDNIFPTGEKITNKNFTGNVWLQPLTDADSVNQNSVGNVTFEPGARTKWHLHPAGQILLVIDGVGYYQERGQPKKILRKGDSLKCSPNVPHWHGASSNTAFVQVAITGREKGETIWLSEVTDEEYNN